MRWAVTPRADTDDETRASSAGPVPTARTPRRHPLAGLQVLVLHEDLVPVGLTEEERELRFVRLAPSEPLAEPLQFGFRGSKLAEEFDRRHGAVPRIVEALQVRQRDLQRIHDLPRALVVRIRHVEDEASDHRLRGGIVPKDVREDREVVLDGVGAALEPRFRADAREALLVPAIG